MEGKGWFVIYGILLFLVIYLFLAQRDLSKQVQELRAEVVGAQDESTPAESAAPDPIVSSTPSPDLISPESRDKKRKNDLHTIKTALFSYHDETKRYPAELADLQTATDLAIIPSDPLSPKYRYRYRKTDQGFLLTCYLEVKDDPDDKKSDGKSDQVYTLSEKSR